MIDAKLLLTARQKRVTLLEDDLRARCNAQAEVDAPLGKIATQHAALQLQAHERVREAVRDRAKVRIEPVLPVDILGAYLLLPVL